jgi:hypothetical protein
MRDERVLWTGQPDAGRIFSSADIFAIPFSLLWGGFAIFWEWNALHIGGFGSTRDGLPSISFFALWGIPFVLIGLYMIVGRFFYKVWARKRTYYAVTNQRVLILSEMFGRKVQSIYLSMLPALDTSIRADGSGTITFGSNSSMDSFYANSGLGFFNRRSAAIAPAFEDIPDVRIVADTIDSARREK